MTKTAEGRFRPDAREPLRAIIVLNVVVGMILFVVFLVKSGKLENAVFRAVLIFELVGIPFTALICLAGLWDYRIDVDEEGIRAPSYFYSFPYRWSYLRWDQIVSIQPVRLFLVHYFVLSNKNGEYVYVPKKIWKQEDYNNAIRNHSKVNSQLLRLIET